VNPVLGSGNVFRHFGDIGCTACGTARQLARAWGAPIGDLLDGESGMIEREVNMRNLTLRLIRVRQDEAQRMMDGPGLRVHTERLPVCAGRRTCPA
jgi:hypothetical protein